MNERRLVRSQDPKTALYLYLVHKAQKLGLSAVAFASADGLLITGTRAPHGTDLDELAAMAPMLSGATQASESFIGRAFPHSEGAVSTRVDFDGEPFFVASAGGVPPRASEVEQTLQRLLC